MCVWGGGGEGGRGGARARARGATRQKHSRCAALCAAQMSDSAVPHALLFFFRVCVAISRRCETRDVKEDDVLIAALLHLRNFKNCTSLFDFRALDSDDVKRDVRMGTRAAITFVLLLL